MPLVRPLDWERQLIEKRSFRRAGFHLFVPLQSVSCFRS
jgi:hypothetical protein